MMVRVVQLLALLVLLPSCQTFDEAEQREKLLDLYMGNAQLYYDGGHYRSAIAQANEVLNLEPNHQKARFVRAMSHLNVGDPIDTQIAQKELRELVQEDFGPRQFRVWIGLTMANAAVGDLFDARVRILDEAIKRNPLDAAKHVPKRDEARREKVANWRASIECAHKVLSFTDIPLARNDPTALYYLYRNHSLLGEHETALKFEERHLGVILASKRTWEKAMEDYPAARDVYQSKLKGATKHEVAVREMMAQSLFELNRVPEALDQLDTIILLDPDRAEPYLNRAQLYREQGMHARAVIDLKRYIKKTIHGPEDPRSIQAVELLRDSQKKMMEDDEDGDAKKGPAD
jgi:tetratricopeptide (TPR) repeat protein